jgi:hypothetical protein
MSNLLLRLGYLQTRRDRTPNLDLARDLAARDDKTGIREIAENMHNDNKHIHSDCMNVMYEIGRVDPHLITPYAADFVKFLKSKHPHMVEGASTALMEISKVNPEFIFKNQVEIKRIAETGSDTAVEKSISALAHTAADDRFSAEVFPYLLQHLSVCPRKDLTERAEKILPAVNERNSADFVKALKKRLDSLSGSDFTRLKKIIRTAENL